MCGQDRQGRYVLATALEEPGTVGELEAGAGEEAGRVELEAGAEEAAPNRYRQVSDR